MQRELVIRQLATWDELRRGGVKRAAREKGWQWVEKGVYAEGTRPVTPLDRALAAVLASGGVASGQVAGELLGLDSVAVNRPDVTVPPDGNGHRLGARRRQLPPEHVVDVHGYRCTDGLQTMLDLACELSDLTWEQALESALRHRLTRVDELEAACEGVPSVARIRRVLALRPAGAPPTESLLETLMVQLARHVSSVPELERQVDVRNRWGDFVARVDLASPRLGVFLELDGQQHPGQPVYDANRQTAVTAATGWLCGRFTWYEVVHLKRVTARRLADLFAQARRRPPAPTDRVRLAGA